ncbi:MAG: ABC transporter permease subunit [Bacteroidaceae bacterium]|nr:ABC transporter permease subunit [Bacteroidaceae bacterium]
MKNRFLFTSLLRCVLVVLLFLFCGCGGRDVRYASLADIDGKEVGCLSSVPADSVRMCFPQSEVKKYDKLINLIVDFEGGGCDAVLLDEFTAVRVLSRNRAYDTLDTLSIAGCTMYAVVPKLRLRPSQESATSIVEWADNLSERFYRNFLDGNARKLIWGGLCTTVVIFIFGVIMAVALASLLTYLFISKKCMWLYRPLSSFIFTIHDVPSVVLMMFFYYVIFAASMNGVVVSIIALGVYTSGTLTKIFKIHIGEVGRDQYEAGCMLGLTSFQIYRYIILPQAVKSMLPLVVGEFKVLLRATSYAGYIAQKDLVKAVDAIREDTLDSFFPLVVVGLLYLFLSWLIVRGVSYLYSKLFLHD